MIYRFLKKMDSENKLGKRIISGLITEENRIKIANYLKDKLRTRMINQISSTGTSHIEDIIKISLKHLSPVTAPLAMVSHTSFSGGSLLCCLLDGHSNLHAYPYVFAAAPPDKGSWPEIDMDGNPTKWLNIFARAITVSGIRKGFAQGAEDAAIFPFIYLPVLERQLFKKYLESHDPLNTRHVFDAHMTACFGAWLNYQHHGLHKKFVTTFAPGLSMQNQAENNFFEIYPDGRLIFIIRDPVRWFVSASRREPQIYGDVGSALSHWKKGVRGIMEARKNFADRICIIQFESLIDQTESVMRHLASFLGISYEDILLEPTFNGTPIQSPDGTKTDHSSGKTRGYSESKALDKNQRALIKKMAMADYQSALQHVVAF